MRKKSLKLTALVLMLAFASLALFGCGGDKQGQDAHLITTGLQ